MRPRARSVPGTALLLALLLGPTLIAQDLVLEEADGSELGPPSDVGTSGRREPTAEELEQGWWLVDGVIEVIGEDTGPAEPGFEDLSGGQPATPEPESDCTREALEAAQGDAAFSSDKFVQGASRFFFLRAAPSRSGWAAIDRVKDPLDDSWLEVSARFGSEYVVQLRGFVYSTDQHYHSKSGGMAWSGGFYDPSKDETHLPAPPCKPEGALKALLVHELTHYRLRLLTDGNIRNFLFLNEGLAQHMERPHSEGWRRKLAYLKQVLEAGNQLAPYSSMRYRVGRNVGFFYGQSWATVAYLEEGYGANRVDALLQRIKAGDDLVPAFRAAFSRTPEQIRSEVTAWIRAQ